MFISRNVIDDNADHDAIVVVHERMRIASAEWETKMAATSDPDEASAACAELVRELDAIDVTSCPMKYQKRYLVLLESLRNVRNVFSDHAHKTDFNRRLDRAIRRTGTAGEKVDKVARKYGALS